MARWQINMNWGTIIDLDGCQFGLETDGRCDMLYCHFRTTKEKAPDKVLTSAMLCPRDKRVEHRESVAYLHPERLVGE